MCTFTFRCLRCDRVTVHVHLMVALTLRCILLVVITEPFIFHREKHYRNVVSITFSLCFVVHGVCNSFVPIALLRIP